MVRYFFDVRDDDGVQPDEVGQELADAAAVDRFALAVAADVMRAELAMGTRRLAAYVIIRGADGAELHEMPFSYAIGDLFGD